jgi:hypothetical protein
MTLFAQAVPSATAVPCVTQLPTGWSMGGARAERGEARFWLDSEEAGHDAVEVRLLPADRCDVAGATPVPSDEVDMQRFERPESLGPGVRTTRTYVFPGGCVRYEYAFDDEASPGLLFAVDQALTFEPRAGLAQEVLDETGEHLCGAGYRCRP